MISSDTMKEDSLNDCKDLISNWTQFSYVYLLIEPRGINYACAFCTRNMEAEKVKVLVAISILITFVSKYILIIMNILIINIKAIVQ